MNAPALLWMPWWAAHRSLRWLAVAMVVIFGGIALAIGIFNPPADRFPDALVMCSIALFFLWAFLFAASALLASDSRQLLLPGIPRQLAVSLVLYGVLCVVVPAYLLCLIGGTFPQAACVLALACAGGLVVSLLPRYLAVPMALIPSFVSATWSRLQLPGVADPRFMPMAAILTLVLLVVAVISWRRLLRLDAGHEGWTSPMVLQFRSGGWAQWNRIGEQYALRQRPDWVQLTADLDDTGPTRLVKSLRVALGGWFMPQTMASYARQLGLLLALLILPTLACILVSLPAVTKNAAQLQGALIGGLCSLGAFVGPSIGAFSLLWLTRRWRHTGGELPLLALLPGLGERARVQRQLLRAGLGLPLGLHGLLLAVLAVAMLAWRGHAAMLSFLMLAQVGPAAMTAALLLNLFGGRPLPTWVSSTMLGLCFLLTAASLVLATLVWGRHVPAAGATVAKTLLPALVLTWVLLCAGMAALAARGWRGFVNLPHPFLAVR